MQILHLPLYRLPSDTPSAASSTSPAETASSPACPCTAGCACPSSQSRQRTQACPPLQESLLKYAAACSTPQTTAAPPPADSATTPPRPHSVESSSNPRCHSTI